MQSNSKPIKYYVMSPSYLLRLIYQELPKDEDEQIRLTGLHFGVKKMFNGNLFPEVYEFTNFDAGVKCLDIGCGPGSFVMDMAVENPKSYFHGIDIAAMFDSQIKLDNTEFSLGNVLTGLPFPDSSFDFIHMRFFFAALRKNEWPVAIKEAYRLLKPGGGIQLCELFPRETGNENCQAVMRTLFSMMRAANQVPEAAENLEVWLKEAGFGSIKSETGSVDLGEESSYTKQWLWVWEQSITASFPHIGPLLGVEKENNEEYIKKHLSDMAESHGILSLNRCLARKPLE
ncbi:S-adenosyl-L-methionine-dependent methyltransferase [Backusella circina FSU 941]|nr:S-adenosyl-L-methionine-dependent methyltransferase [Backusella circina FSU 941]